ncbi:retrovirus-related pol polyprotein from transposon TNT 1-94 [Tanacetum coccineum]
MCRFRYPDQPILIKTDLCFMQHGFDCTAVLTALRIYFNLSQEEKYSTMQHSEQTNIITSEFTKRHLFTFIITLDAKTYDNVKMLWKIELTNGNRVCCQNVQGRHNKDRVSGAAGYGGAQNRVGNANPGQARQVKCYNCNGVGHIARNCTQPKRPQNSEYFKDKMLLMQAQENGVVLDEEQLLFLAGGQDNAIDEDVDEQPVQDLALNVDNVFQADDCDAYDSDVDEAPTAQTMFMANLSSADPVCDEAGPSYDSDILSEVQDHDHFQDAICEHHEEHGMQDDVQPSYVVGSHADYTSDSNMTPYDQYVKDNAVPVVQNNASTVPNDMYVMIDNDLHEPKAQSVFKAPTYTVADNSLNAELAIYKEQVELYERRARFELTEREQKIDEQLRIVICDRNIKEENLKKELHSKENKYLEEFLDLKALKDKVEDKLFKQGQSIQTVHMMCKPRSYYDEVNKMKAEAVKEQNTRPIKALTVCPPNKPATLVLKVLPTKSQVKINIFTLRQLFSEFEKTYKKRITRTGITEGERGFEQTKTCYLTEVILFFKTLQENFEGTQKALTKEVKEMSDAFDELEAELDQSIVDRKHDEIEQKNLLIEHDNIIADGLSKEVFYVASKSELNVSRFTEMQKAHNVVKARCLELEAELSNLRDNIHKDNYNELLNRFSNLEVNHLNLQLKYQNLKDSFQNKPSSPVNDTPDFNSFFVIGQMKSSLQGKDNVNVLQEQNELFRAKNAKIKQHYKELYDSIKITHAKHREQITALKNENESLKVQLQNTVSCVTTNQVKPNVLALGKYAIDVKPIPPRNRNNREVHLHYLRHLKESVDALREIVEEAKVERPLDRSLASACRYTKHSQELLEYVFGTCPKVFYQQDKKHAHAPRKKKVTFEDQIATSSRVNSCTDASGSQPRSILKKHQIPPAKSDSMKKVEEHPRTIRSSLKTTNRVDSSNSSKRTVVQIVLWYLDSGCSKHMTGDRSRLMNFVKKFIGTVRFGNDHFGAIMGYGDYVIGDSVISRVYYVEGLGHNLFSVGQFCDSDLEVAFRKHSCYVRDTDGVELLKGSHGSNLYTISVEEMMKSSPICLLSKASKHKSWLWHRRLNHLNFGTINDLARKDLVRGLPRLKFEKDHLCSACQLGKSKKHTDRSFTYI